jgi:NAD(P)H dehydrogenase (quinone)
VPRQEPIRHLVILGHPSETSFNRAIAESYCAAVRECGQTALLRDLYGQGFDPLLRASERPGSSDLAPDVADELALVRGSDAIVLVYPIWFGMPPAIIKGYIDRVLGAGLLARDIKTGAGHGLLEGKRLVILSSSASTMPWLEEHGQWASMRQTFDTYLTTIFAMADNSHVHFDAIVDGRDERFMRENLERVTEQARQTCSVILSERHADRIRALSQGGAS